MRLMNSTMTGLDPADFGLDMLVIEYPNGCLQSFQGIAVEPGDKIIDTIWRSLPEGSKLYPDIACYHRDEYAVLH